MITETGRVVAIEKDCLWVETLRRSTCNACSAQKACGHGLINKMQSDAKAKAFHVRALLPETSASAASSAATDYALGDEVTISIPEKVLLSGALLVYLLPLLLMLAGAMLGDQLASATLLSANGFSALGAAAGLALGFGCIRLHASYTRNRLDMQPKVLAVLSRTSPELVNAEALHISRPAS